MRYIGIDVGRSLTKLATERGVIMFPSVVGEYRDLRLGSAGDYTVTIDGERYYVGHAARESFSRREMATESKLHPETTILFLSALAMAAPGPDSVIVTGLPVVQHEPATKQALRSLLDGRHVVRIGDGIERVITATDLVICPEGAAAWWSELLDDAGEIARPDLMGHQRQLIVDIGSRTVNYVTLLYGEYLDRDSGTLPYGARELDSAGDSDEARKGMARRILADLSSRITALPQTELVMLAGGGALSVGPHLTQLFPQVEYVRDPVSANVRGYRRLGMEYAAR